MTATTISNPLVARDVAPLAVHPHEPAGLHGERAAEQRDAHVLAHAGAAALEQGRRDREGEHGGRVEVDRGAVDDLGISGLALLDADAGHGLQNLIVAGPILQRTGVAVAGERAIDEARVDRPHALVVDAEPLRHGRPEVVHHHVGALDEAAKHAEPARPLQVEADALLVAVDPEEGAALARQGRGIVAEVVPFGRLDLDDARAEVTQQRAAVGSGHVAAQVEHRDAAQRPMARTGAPHRAGVYHGAHPGVPRGSRPCRRRGPPIPSGDPASVLFSAS